MFSAEDCQYLRGYNNGVKVEKTAGDRGTVCWSHQRFSGISVLISVWTPFDVNMDITDGAEELSLEEILSLYNQPINEEQGWAVCYQCCRTLVQKHRRRQPRTSSASVGDLPRRIEGPGDVRILRDGTVALHHRDSAGKQHNVCQNGNTVRLQKV